MNETYTIREMRPDDFEIMLHQRRSMFLDLGSPDIESLDSTIATARPFFVERLANGRYKGWFIETQEGKVVAGGGIIINDNHASPIDPHPLRPRIVNVYTEKEYRRRGLARRLMQTMIAWCREQGFGTVLLGASPEGRSLYASLGFEQTNEMRLKL